MRESILGLLIFVLVLGIVGLDDDLARYLGELSAELVNSFTAARSA